MAGPSKGIRLSFLAQADQNKYEMVFAQASGGNDVLSASSAKEVLSKSNIGDECLAHIWDLSNVTNDAQLTFPEFSIAMYLTSLKMTGIDIPSTLPDTVKKEVQNAVIASRSNHHSSIVPVAPSVNTQPTGISTNFNSLQVSMPTGMLGDNMNFASRMMPNTTSHTEQLQFRSSLGTIKIPWAVSEEEKKQYTKVFKAWDSENTGTLSGETAKEIFSQSGLAQNVLMQIWNLSDTNNQGKLNLNEFAVAMHLIYRKLNGYNVPETLPPELVPPSTRELTDSVSKLKQSILDGIAKKKNIDNFSSSSSSPSPSTKYKYHSTKTSDKNVKKIESNEKDIEVGYVSSARRMGPDRARTRDLSATKTNSSYGYRGKTTRLFDLRKDIEENKKILLILEQESLPKVSTPYTDLSALDKKSVDETKEKIKELQTEIARSGDEHGQDLWDFYIQKSGELSSVAEEEKGLETEVDYFLNVTLSGLLAQVNETENDLMNRKIQAESKNTSNENKAPLDIVGTGPGGQITESDRIRAKAKAMVAARMGKITGKSTESSSKAVIDKIKQEREEFEFYTKSIEEDVRQMKENLKAISLEMRMIGLDIRKQDQDQKAIEERERFEHGKNVATDLKEFIAELIYEDKLTKAPEIDPSFESRFPSF